ncbi:MAG: dihydropteroate synthase [Clostridia bacterium]|nr:dihydropteroate synthase [Clostridia bacterium]
MTQLAKKGVSILGGCCGTTPEYIRETVSATRNIPLRKIEPKNITVVSSYTHGVVIGNEPVLIGERINPTGKSKLKEALRTNNMNYILSEGIKQADKGVHILDVNVGLPEIDEAEMMKNAVYSLQTVTNLPLQIDSASPKALEKAMRIYNGKPLINSVNGEKESMESVFPLVKKYGGVVIALTMDESGIPDNALDRLNIAQKIASVAKTYGIDKKDIVVDPLCMAVSSDSRGAIVTLESVRLLKEHGFKTSLGVSNVSFGLPERGKINSTFFSNALENGLDCAIMNPDPSTTWVHLQIC